MAFIRNNIEIEGIEAKDGVTEGSYVLNYWENGPIFLPRSKGKIRHLNKVIIELNSIEGKIINTPAGKVLSIYGRKVYSLIYSEKSHDRSQKTNIDLPFIAYVYLPVEVEDFCDLEVSVMDAFFEVIDNRKVHNHILYLIKFNKKDIVSIEKKEELPENIQGQLTLSDLEKMIMSSPLKDVLKSSALLQSGNGKEIEENNDTLFIESKSERLEKCEKENQLEDLDIGESED